MKIKHHETAGTVLYKKINNSFFILLQYKKWDKDKLEGWFMPKGHIEKGESPEQAAKRECIEETGYEDIAMGNLIKTQKIEYPWSDGFLHKKTIHWYAAELMSERIRPTKLSVNEKRSLVKQKWFDVNDAVDKIKFDHDKKIIEITINNFLKS